MEHILKAVKMLRNNKREEAHKIAQDDQTMIGSWLHGIVHIIEGDELNARYWYKKASRTFPGINSAESEIEAIYNYATNH